MQVNKKGELINAPIYRIGGDRRRKIKKQLASMRRDILRLNDMPFQEIYRFNHLDYAELGQYVVDMVKKMADMYKDLRLKW